MDHPSCIIIFILFSGRSKQTRPAIVRKKKKYMYLFLYSYTILRKFLMGFIFLSVSADYGLVLLFGGKRRNETKSRIRINKNKKINGE